MAQVKRENVVEEHEAMVARLADLMEKGFRLVGSDESFHCSGSWCLPKGSTYHYCAMGMACLGLRGSVPQRIAKEADRWEFTSVPLEYRAKIDLNDRVGTQPDTGEPYPEIGGPDLGNAIITVNDTLLWSMPRIIEWLRSLRWDNEKKHFFTPKEEGGTQA